MLSLSESMRLETTSATKNCGFLSCATLMSTIVPQIFSSTLGGGVASTGSPSLPKCPAKAH